MAGGRGASTGACHATDAIAGGVVVVAALCGAAGATWFVAEADAAALAAIGGTTRGATTGAPTGGAGFAAATGAGACGVATGAAFRKSSPRDASISATNSPRTGAVGAAASKSTRLNSSHLGIP